MKMSPLQWRRLLCVFELDGFLFHKGKGDHWVGEKEGVLRPVVIPEYSEVGLDIYAPTCGLPECPAQDSWSYWKSVESVSTLRVFSLSRVPPSQEEP